MLNMFETSNNNEEIEIKDSFLIKLDMNLEMGEVYEYTKDYWEQREQEEGYEVRT